MARGQDKRKGRLRRLPRRTLNAASRVGDFLAERQAQKERVFNAVFARAGYLASVGGVLFTVVFILAIIFPVLEDCPKYSIFGRAVLSMLAYAFIGVGTVLMTTLSPDTFDLDKAFDVRPAPRRTSNVLAIVLCAFQASVFPVAPLALSTVAFIVKLAWDEWTIGCCGRATKRRSPSTVAPLSNAGSGRARDRSRVPGEKRVLEGRCMRYRPRMSDTWCIFLFGMIGLHWGMRNIFGRGPCHAGLNAAGGHISHGHVWGFAPGSRSRSADVAAYCITTIDGKKEPKWVNTGTGLSLAECAASAAEYTFINHWASDGRCRGLHTCPYSKSADLSVYDEDVRTYKLFLKNTHTGNAASGSETESGSALVDAVLLVPVGPESKLVRVESRLVNVTKGVIVCSGDLFGYVVFGHTHVENGENKFATNQRMHTRLPPRQPYTCSLPPRGQWLHGLQHGQLATRAAPPEAT